ncbi:hypothetical protein [Leptothermofonsia sp. ETS-13]|uniref:hypothetical protein n=1 Tax=Leptothermofonsia sp. ETS-13 TaxID=3035696 RepID=UPI003BA2FB8B
MMHAHFTCRVLGIFLAFVLFLSMVLGGNVNQVSARPLTPEASAYDVDKPTTPEMGQWMQQEKSRTNLKRVASESIPAVKGTENEENIFQRAVENVQEKLNLDEPAPQSTKDFLNDVKTKASNAVDR